MGDEGNISRRQFVAAAISTAAVSSLPTLPVFSKVRANGNTIPQTAVAPRPLGSPYCRLCDRD
jgi:hypothetical protein